MINRIVLVGRATRDPELRSTNSDKPVTSFSIAVDNGMKNQDGTRGTCFLNCTVFNQQAENVAKFTRKGSLVGVEGRLNQRNFTRKDGKTYIHIFDSKTGRPVENEVASVTIVSESGLYGDGLSTSMFALGVEKAFDYCISSFDINWL